MDEQTVDYYQRNAQETAALWERSQGAERYFSIAFPAGARVLDIGSGSGRDLARLLTLGYDAVGIDPSSVLRNESVRLHPELLGRVSMGALPADVPSDGPFDGVLCLGVLQHLPKSQLFDAAYAIKGLLKPHGRVLVVISGQRSHVDATTGRDERGRLFTAVVPDELALLFERIGYQCIGRWTGPDQLGRGFDWTTILFELRSAGLTRPLDMVEAVLSRDKKVATYKLALFRALCDIALTQTHSVRWGGDHRVAVPINAVADLRRLILADRNRRCLS